MLVDGPSYTYAVFNLKLGLGKLLLIGTREFYLEAARIVDGFEVTKTNHRLLCLFVERKKHKDSNEREILEGHKLHNPDFDRNLKLVHKIRKLNRSLPDLSEGGYEGGQDVTSILPSSKK